MKGEIFKNIWEHKRFSKTYNMIILIKYYIIQNSLCLRILYFMFSANFIFVSHLKIYPAVYLNTNSK